MMSLYDGLDIDDKAKDDKPPADVSGWGSIHQMLQTQRVLQAKNKASLMQPKRRGGATLQPVIDLKRQNATDEVPAGGALHFNQTTGRLERMMMGGGDAPTPPMFIGSEPPSISMSLTGVPDEYNPLRPNDYEDFVKKRKEQRAREREEERRKNPEKEKRRRFNETVDDEEEGEFERAKKRREASSEEEEEASPPRRAGGGAAIAPPTSLMEQDSVVVEKPPPTPPPPAPPGSPPRQGLGNGGPGLGPNFGNVGSVASKIMAKYGYKEGQGLGRKEQGMSTALLVEKTSKRGGKIIHEKDIPKMMEPPRAPEIAQTNANLLKNPSKVILLRNMVGPGEVDDDLEPETAEECTKYGKVTKCVIFEIRDSKGGPVSDEEAVRIFVEFERMESAIKAVVDLNGRFFGGRIVKGGFYNLDKFRRLDLADDAL